MPCAGHRIALKARARGAVAPGLFCDGGEAYAANLPALALIELGLCCPGSGAPTADPRALKATCPLCQQSMPASGGELPLHLPRNVRAS